MTIKSAPRNTHFVAVIVGQVTANKKNDIVGNCSHSMLQVDLTLCKLVT